MRHLTTYALAGILIGFCALAGCGSKPKAGGEAAASSDAAELPADATPTLADAATPTGD